jgi:hypothetical protein
MNITIKQNPVFQILNGNLSFDISESLPTGNEFKIWKQEEIRSFIGKDLNSFRQNAMYVQQSFFNALHLSHDSLQKALTKDSDYIYSNLKYSKGVILTIDGGHCFYSIDTINRTFTAIIVFDKDPVFGFFNKPINSKDDDSATKYYLGKKFEHFNDNQEAIEELNRFLYTVFHIPLFRTFADHDVISISGQSKGKLNKINYKNRNNHSINVLDSTWYTSIARTEGFMVSGHLRMQACGAGLTERKLIYIDSFEKHGYIRKAKMLPRNELSITEIIN